MRTDPAFRLRQELADKDILLSQLRDLCANDPQLLADSIEGETEFNELIDLIVANLGEKDQIIDGTASALKKMKERKAAAEKQKETLSALLAVTLDRMGKTKHICSDGSVLGLARTPPVAKVTEEVDLPSRWTIPQPPKIDQDGLTKYIRARLKAMAEAEKLDGEERMQRLREIAQAFPPIPGVVASNGSFSLRRT